MKTTHQILRITLLIVALFSTAQAGDHNKRREHHNYIIERQQAMPGLGVPTSRLIIGKREIDIYRDGMMFERAITSSV